WGHLGPGAPLRTPELHRERGEVPADARARLSLGGVRRRRPGRRQGDRRPQVPRGGAALPGGGQASCPDASRPPFLRAQVRRFRSQAVFTKGRFAKGRFVHRRPSRRCAGRRRPATGRRAEALAATTGRPWAACWSWQGRRSTATTTKTDHPGGREPFRESGVKLRIDVHYTNLGSWLGSWESLGYSYKVRIIPAASVWDGLTISSLREARAWLSPDKLKDFGQYDRVLVFADGIQVSAKLHGKLGALDMTQLLLTVVSALLLLFFAELIAEMLAACLLGEGRPAGANQRLAAGEQPGASSCTAAAVAEDEEEAGEHLLRRAEHPPGSGGGDGR
ncbi:unnamed protein product, partial [Prorocentrum cordatum]